FHLAADRPGDAAHLTADPDLELLFVIMAAVALIDMDAARGDPGLLLELGITGPSVWPSNGLPCSALACSTNCPPLGLVAGVVIDPLQPNSYGARALPLPMHSTSGACSAYTLGPRCRWSWKRTRTARARRSAKRSWSTSLPAILRRMSRITRPSRMRRNLSWRRARLNWWAWLY